MYRGCHILSHHIDGNIQRFGRILASQHSLVPLQVGEKHFEEGCSYVPARHAALQILSGFFVVISTCIGGWAAWLVWSSVPYNSKLWIELELKSGSIPFNSYNVRFESIQFVVAANCNLNWIGRGMWAYLKNPLRLVVSRPHTEKKFCISVNLEISINLFHLSISFLVAMADPSIFEDIGTPLIDPQPPFTYHEWPWIYCQFLWCLLSVNGYSPRRTWKHWLPSAAIEWKLIL